jgi:hypothetical protein
MTTDQKQMKFSFTELKRLIADGPLKNLQDAKNYLSKFFFPLTNGMIMFSNNGVKKMLSTEVFRTTYASRFGKELSNWFLRDTVNIYDIIIDTHKPFINDDSINTFAGFKHVEGKEFSKKAKKGCKMMLDFIKQVWCNNNDESYEYVLNWLSNMIKGNKNNTILYLKSFVEGIGKSTVTQFILYHVLGKDICIESNSDVLKSPYNEILSGKLMVVFEELESASDRDWQLMSTKLKRWSTSDEIVYSDKYIKSYTSNNINNYIINTNVEAIKASEGRRYYSLDLSTKFKNDHEYFDNLYATCFNDEVGHIFYQFMMERDTTKFNPQKFTETQTKKIAQSERLHPLFKFLKFNYILDGKDLVTLTKDLYEEYLTYAALIETPTKLTKNKMISLLREHAIDYKTSNGKMTYNITNKQLREIGNKYKWFFDDDNEEHDENRLIKTGTAVKFVMTANEIKMAAEIERLKKIIDDMQKQVVVPTPIQKQKKKVIKHEPEPEPENLDDDEHIQIHSKNLFLQAPIKVVKNTNIKTLENSFDNAFNRLFAN